MSGAPPQSPTLFSKRVPATSTSPTFKLTLPAEVVQGALSHLCERTFQLTDASRQHNWEVYIQKRRNKDKHEHTLQGWRAFAQDQNVRTGDLLKFSLLPDADDRLQISVHKPPTEAQPGAEPGVSPGEQPHQASALLRGSAPGGRTGGESEPDLRAGLAGGSVHCQLFAGRREEQASPRRLPSRASGASTELDTPRQAGGAQGWQQPFQRGGAPAAAEGLWPALEPQQRKRRAGEALHGPGPEAGLEYGQLGACDEDDLLLGRLDFAAPPDPSGSPALATPAVQPPASLLPLAGSPSPLAPGRSGEQLLGVPPPGGLRRFQPRSAFELEAALDVARMQAARAQAEADALAHALGSLRGEVLHTTIRCLGLARTLCGSANSLPLLGTPAAAAAGLDAHALSEQLQRCTRTIYDLLFHLQSCSQERELQGLP